MGYTQFPGSGSSTIPTYANFGSLPAVATDGAAAITLDTDQLYIYNLATTTWLPTGGPSVPLNVGALDSAAPNANALTIGSNTVYTQSAGPTFPGVVNSGSQTFSGVKTFNSSPVVATLGTAPVKSVAGSLVSGSISLSSEVSGNLPLSQTSGSISLVNQVVGNLPISQTSGSISQSQLGFVIANGSTSGATLVGAIDSVAASGNGAVIGSATLFLQSASATNPGLVSSASQTFGGVKTFSNAPKFQTAGSFSILATDVSGSLVGMPYSPIGGTSNVVTRDSNSNTIANNFISKSTSTVSAGSTTLLTAASTRVQVLTGASVQNYNLPDATTLTNGAIFTFNNNSTGLLTVKDFGTNVIATVPFGGFAQVICIANVTANGSWDFHSLIPSNSSWGTNGVSITNSVSMTGLTVSAPVKTDGSKSLVSGSISLTNDVTGNLPVSQTSGSMSLTQMGFALLTNPMTNSGDMITGSANGVAARIPAGTAGQYLVVSSTGGVPSFVIPPAAYKANVYYAGSNVNFWSIGAVTGGYGRLLTNGTIPSPVSLFSSNFGTIGFAIGSTSGISFSAPKTGILELTCNASIIPTQSPSTVTWALGLFETLTIGSVQIAFANGSIGPNNVNNVSEVIPLKGYMNTVASTTYNIALMCTVSTGTFFIGGSVGAGSQLSFLLSYAT